MRVFLKQECLDIPSRTMTCFEFLLTAAVSVFGEHKKEKVKLKIILPINLLSEMNE